MGLPRDIRWLSGLTLFKLADMATSLGVSLGRAGAIRCLSVSTIVSLEDRTTLLGHVCM